MKFVNIKLFDNSVSTEEKRFFYLIALVWGHFPILHFLEALSNRVVGPLVTLILFALLWTVTIFGAMGVIAKRLKSASVIVLFLILFIYGFNYILFPQNIDALNYNAGPFFLSALPCFILGSVVQVRKGIDFLYYISLLSILAQYSFSFVYGNNQILADEGEGGDQLTAAYNLLPHVLLTIYYFIKKRNWVPGLLSILGVILLISFGSRGPILCLLIFVFLTVFFTMRERKYSPVKYLYFVLICLGLLVLFSQAWQFIIEAILSSQNMSDRLAVKLMEGGFLESDDRNEIKLLLIKKLSEYPIMGYGVAGDRLVIGSIESGYAHNLIYEMLFSFGYVFGGGLLIVITIQIFKGLKYYSGDEKYFVLVLISCGFIGLLFSGTYLNSKWFFFLMGVCSVAKENFILERIVYKIQS